MRGKISLFARKAVALVMATAMSFPTGVLAAESHNKTYNADSSIMGLVEIQDSTKEAIKSNDNTITKENDNYILEAKASLDESLDKIRYHIRVIRKNKAQQEELEYISLSLSPNPNSSINNLKLEKAYTKVENDLKEIALAEETIGTEIKSLSVKSKAYDEIYIDYLADIRQAKDQRTYNLLLSLNDGKENLNLAYNLISKKETTIENEHKQEIIKLEKTIEQTDNIKGQILDGGLLKAFQAKDTIVWTDYLLNSSDKNKTYTYDLNLDDKQETDQTKISLDYYEQTDQGFILKKDFSKSLDFAKKIEFEIPAGFIAKLSLKTRVDKKNTAVKAYHLNNKQIANPIYKEGNTKKSPDDKTENSDDEDADKNHSQAKPNIDQTKEKVDNKKESETQIEVKDSNGKDIPVISDSDIKSADPKENKNEIKKELSALVLNRDALIHDLKSKGRLDDNKKAAIEELTNKLEAFNADKITWQELKDYSKSIKERYQIEKSDLTSYLDSILAGLNQSAYKVAGINKDEIISYAYPAKAQATDQKDQEKEVTVENNHAQIKDKAKEEKSVEKSEPKKEKADDKNQESQAPTANKEKALNEFDQELGKLKEEAKTDTANSEKNGLVEGLKELFGQSDLKKADKELKTALANEKNGLAEIQALLASLGEKYQLSRADQAKLMEGNEKALKALIAKDTNENLRPSMLFANPANNIANETTPLSEEEKKVLDTKKFTINSRFDTSVVAGPIQKGQFFEITLDNKLKVKDPSTLPNLMYNGQVIAKPSYDSNRNVIRYTVDRIISENIQVPIQIPVDYNTDNVRVDSDGYFTVINKVSGTLLLNPPKDLLPQRMYKNGSPAGSIIEPGRGDVSQIIEPDDSKFKTFMDVKTNPVIKNGELEGYNWTIKISSDRDLSSLGYKVNFTTVKGSGLGKIESKNPAISLEDNNLGNSLGINDSKHHAPRAGLREITYNLYTPAVNKQEKYMLDVSAILINKEKDKVGAERIIMYQAYTLDKVKQATPTRVDMNNRTTVMGEFDSESTAKWTVTDAISTGDNKIPGGDTKLPIESRKLSGGQSLVSGKVAVYKIDQTTGRMVQDGYTQQVSSIPAKGTNPNTDQEIGTIAVYEYKTNTNDSSSRKAQSLSGVEISRYEDLDLDQSWGLDEGLKIPSQTLRAVDPQNPRNILGSTSVGEEVPGQEANRNITIRNVKVWDLSTGVAKKVQPKIEQTFPTANTTSDGRPISYYENHNYFDKSKDKYIIHNGGTVEYIPKRANFTIIKTDKNDPKKKLEGAKFKILNGPEVTTDANGEAVFNNINPGIYTIFETKAPNGYKLNTENSRIRIDDEGGVNLLSGQASISVGNNPTKTVAHNVYPDYMNAMQYASKDSSGKVVTYIFLKANEAQRGGSTNKDTRLNLRMNSGSISKVEVFDVNPDTQRDALKAAMTQQKAETMVRQLGVSVLNSPNDYPIRGQNNAYDQFLQKTGYQISLPQQRLIRDWGFLVRVEGVGTSLTYDWLTDGDVNFTNGNARLQNQNIVPSSSTDTKKTTTITITNEPFETRPVEVKKLDKDKKAISGATFVIRDSNGTILSTEISDAEGKASFGKLPEGKYTIEETEAPEGYIKSNVLFDVIVDSSNQVTYKPRYKNGSGSPINGEDYLIDEKEQGQDESVAQVTGVTQDLIVNDKQGGSIGKRPGIWEAYMLESLKYTATISLNKSAPGTRFSIQFDKNLDFTQYFGEFPKLNINGVDVADPYFDYTTNKLTYVFNDNSKGGEAVAKIELIGIIPSKYYAKNDGKYDFTITAVPGTPKENTITRTVQADYGRYDYDPKDAKPPQSYYFRDVYKAEDGNWYVKVLAYYNPHYLKPASNDELNFNWKSTNYQEGNYVKWKGNGQNPAFSLTDVKVYRTSPWMGKLTDNVDTKTVNYNMPLSFGVRPEQDPITYHLLYSRAIDPNTNIDNDRQGDIVLNYDRSKINAFGTLEDKGPLSIRMPNVNNNNKDGYIIEQTFRIDDMYKFNNSWRAFDMSNGPFHSAFVTRANYNKATGDQTEAEIPKFFTQEVGLINKKYTPGRFKILKLNETNNKKLSGAGFSLTYEEDNSTIYRTSDSEGLIQFEDLKPGRYTLKEEQPPEGFIKSDRRWSVIISIDGTVSITELGLGASGGSITGKENIQIPVTNKPKNAKFVVYKKDDKNHPLAGAEFKLSKKGENTVYATGTSDTNGVVNFNRDLEKGLYILEETKAPNGYKRLDQKWVVEVDNDSKVKIYNHSDSQSQPGQEFDNSLLVKDNVNWVRVAQRPTHRFIQGDNRQTGYTNNSLRPYKLGTRIVGINKTEKYVIQRYVINPEGEDLNIYNAIIHREKPFDSNMDWYAGNEDIKIYTLDKPVTTNVEDIRLYSYDKLTEITDKVSRSPLASSYSNRLQLDLNDDRLKDASGNSIIKGKPIIVDVKVPYKSEYGGVGTGMDIYTNEGPYWKSDYYEQVTDIVEGDPAKQTSQGDNIKGSYISDDYLDVNNEKQKYGFAFDKVNAIKNDAGNYDAVTGATFKLVGPDTSTTEKWAHSDAKGKVEFKDLVPGKYKLVETGPAQGYEPAKTDWTITIKEDGKTYIKSNDQTRTVKDVDLMVGKWGPVSPANLVNPRTVSLFSLLGYNRSAMLETSLGESEPLDMSDFLMGGAVRAVDGWEAVDPSLSEGRRTGDLNKNGFGSTKITEINKTTKRFRQEFTYLQSPFGAKNRTIEIHRQPEEYDLDKADTNIRVYQLANGVKNDITSKISFTNPRKGNYKRLVSGTIGTGITGTLIIEIETSYRTTNGIGLGSDYNNNTTGQYNNKTWITDSYSNEAGINKNKTQEPTYTVRLGQTINGSISVVGNKTTGIKMGESVTIDAKPNNGYELDTLTYSYGGNSYDIKNTKTFTMPAADVTVNATFKEKTQVQPQTEHNLWVNGDSNGSIKATPSGKVAAGTEVRIDVYPNPGYELENITYYDPNLGMRVEVVGTSFKMPNFDITLNPKFRSSSQLQKQYTIKNYNGTGGVVAGVPTRATEGYQISLQTYPSEGYSVERIWLEDESGNFLQDLTNSTGFSMPGKNVVIKASFVKNKYQISTSVTNNVGGSITANPQTQASGEKYTVTVTPNSGYVLARVTKNGSDVTSLFENGSYTFTMGDGDINFVATFKPAPSYIVGTSGDASRGTIRITKISNPRRSEALAGEKVEFQVEANHGFEVDRCYVMKADGSREIVDSQFDGRNGSFIMPETNVTIYVNYKREIVPEDSKQIYIEPTSGGVVTTSTRIAKIGSKVRLSLQPYDDYSITSYYVKKADGTGNVDIESDSEGLYFIMPDTDVTVYSTFRKQTSQGAYRVNILNNIENGRVSANLSTANPGDKISLTAIPNQGFILDKYIVRDATGREIDVVANVFTMPASDVSISASFAEYDPELGFLIKDGNKSKPVQITNRKGGISPKVIKTDTRGDELEGAVFTIKKMTDSTYSKEDTRFKQLTGTTVKEKDQNGKEHFVIKFKDEDGNEVKLQKGHYLMREEKSPDGYKKITAPWRLEVKDDGGRIYAVYKGPQESPSSFIDNNELSNAKSFAGTDIKVKSRLTYINPESKTYVQRIYIDTRNYTGGDYLNVQITPKYKREEIDRPGLPPVTIKEGVKTAYRTTYKLVNPDENVDIQNQDFDKILRSYDLSHPDMSMVNTARWRPFDWGFDEDQLNIGKGVYIVEIEGYYDDTIINGTATNEVYVDNNYNFTDAQGNPSKEPVKKAPYKKAETEISPADYGKLDLHVDFYKGKREFQQLVVDKNGYVDYKAVEKASFQGGVEELRKYLEKNNGKEKADKWAGDKPAGQKYANFVSKKVKINDTEYVSGRIWQPLGNSPYHHADTSVNLNPIYSSDKEREVPQSGLVVENERERYNITFSKHGRDGTGDEWSNNSENVTRNRLEGAVFRLEKYVEGNYEEVPGSTVASAFNGYFGFRNLAPGRYRLYEVQAPKGYRPITDPLLHFTVETIKTNSGEILNPENGKKINIKDITVKFPGERNQYTLANLYMANPKKPSEKVLVKGVDAREISMETVVYKSATDTNGKALKELILVGSKNQEFQLNQAKIIPNSSGYVSLEYNSANGVYQYIPEKSTSEKDGKLVDFVTSATAKNMGKILNEKPGKGAVTISKKDGSGHSLQGAEFTLTRISSKKIDANNPDSQKEDTKDKIVLTGTSNSEGKIEFKELPIGNYELRETKAVDGYQNRGQIWHFTVGGKDLDPYSGPIQRTGVDLTDKISIHESKMEIVRPDNNPKTNKDNTIWPNSAQILRFNNDFKIASGTTIRPGDYFQVKVSDYMNLYGIYNKNLISGLDIFADGVGTIAKAEYDDVNGIITYTFTEYARTYELTDFNTSIIGHINRFKLKNSQQNVPVGIKINSTNATDTFKNIDVVYDLGTHYAQAYGTRPNISSKITYFDSKTGDFEHIFYLNRDQNLIQDGKFTYKPGKNVDKLNIQVFRVTDGYLSTNNEHREDNKDAILPPSYGVDIDSFVNNRYIYLLNNYTSYGSIDKDEPAVYTFPNGYLQPEDTYIIRVTGSIRDKSDTGSYEGQGKIDRYNYYDQPYMGAERSDYVYELVNNNNAEAKLEITALNPKNEISFKKTDTEGTALKGAKFTLEKYNNSSAKWEEVSGKEMTTGTDGIIKYEMLAPGKYALVEKEAPEGYNKLEGHIQVFTVGDDGVITREVEKSTESSNSVSRVIDNLVSSIVRENADTITETIGTDPINVINYKKIEFVKVDAYDHSKPLKGAEFELYYKEKEEDTAYKPYQITEDGVTKTLAVTSDNTGKFLLPISKNGYYALKEIKAPEGYIKTDVEYIKEFKLENGNLSVLEKDLKRISLYKGKKSKITSQILEVDKDKKTFTQRIIINPNHDTIPLGDKKELLLRILENGWSITPKSTGSVKGGIIKAALVDKDKKLTSLDASDFVEYSPKTYQTIGSNTGSRYDLKEIFGNTATSTDKSIVIEYTGTITDTANTIAQKEEIIEDNSILDQVEYTLDIGKLASGNPAYVETNNSHVYPVEVENIKPKTIKIKKVDGRADAYGKKKALAGAEFKLLYKAKESDDWTEPEETKTSNNDGLVEFKDIYKKGYYAIKETKAPEGYAKPFGDGIIKEFVLGEDGKLLEKLKATDKFIKSLVKTTIEETKYTWEINPDYKEIATTDLKLSLDKDSLAKMRNFKLYKFSGSGTPTIVDLNVENETIDLSKQFGASGKTKNKLVISAKLNLPDGDVDIKSSLMGIGDNPIDIKTKFNKSSDKQAGTEFYKSYVEPKATDGSDVLEVDNYKVELPKASGLASFIGYSFVGILVMLAGVFIYYQRKKQIDK